MTERRMENTLDDYFSSLLKEPSLDYRKNQQLSDDLPASKPLPTASLPLTPQPKLQPTASTSVRAKPLSTLLEESSKQVHVEPEQIQTLPQVLPVFRAPNPIENIEVTTEVITEVITEVSNQVNEERAVESDENWENLSTEDSFQALFFEAAGVTFGVLLTELGGIHQLTEVSPLFGKPDWFAGMMLQREEKLSVVDTVKWVMPNQSIEADYKYLVMLGETSWGLGCERLLGTELLHHNDVKWRKIPGKRPWLAGMIKQKMCALLHVSEFIAMLDKGVNIEGC